MVKAFQFGEWGEGKGDKTGFVESKLYCIREHMHLEGRSINLELVRATFCCRFAFVDE